MKAMDFNLAKNIKFDFENGITSFQENRLVIFDANAIGLLRQNLLEELGFEKARAFFLRFGYQHGFADFLSMRVNFQFESDAELALSGTVIHTWEGIVKAKTTDFYFNRQKGKFYAIGQWLNSYESEQHLTFNEPSTEPVCWSLMGYAAGWSSAFFGQKLICIEPSCVGMGDKHCAWEIQPPAAWGNKAKPYIEALAKF